MVWLKMRIGSRSVVWILRLFERVWISKFEYFALSDTVRYAYFSCRSCSCKDFARDSSSGQTSSYASRSFSNVVSVLIDSGGPVGSMTSSASRPIATSCKYSPNAPSCSTRSWRLYLCRSSIISRPSSFSRSAVFGPTPRIFRTEIGARNAAPASRGLDARHRRSDAEPAGLVARGQDDAAAMLSRVGSHDDGFPLERRILADLDGRVEGIHVHVEDDPRTREWRGHTPPDGPRGR